MAFTATQKQDVKKHLGLPPTADVLDTLFAELEDGGAIESKVTRALSRANETLENLITAQDEADEIVEGAGARFSYERMISIKKTAYQNAVNELCRLFSWQNYTTGEIIGFYNP